MLNKLKNNWYFIRQDIVSYLIPTIMYITLCLFREFSFQSALYGSFEIFTFYIPFWYIRVNFSDTYHSDVWEHCRKWTRIMLCTGAFVLWILPIHYSLFNGLFVAFVCCLILYLVALETNAKKEIIRQLENYMNPKAQLLQRCADAEISERDTKVAIMYYLDRCTPKQIWHWLCAHENNMELDSVYKLLNRLNKKLK